MVVKTESNASSGLPSRMGGVAAASADGVMEKQNQILLINHNASAKPSAPLLARRGAPSAEAASTSPKHGGEFFVARLTTCTL
jgi:hypothetical protein